MGYRLVHEALMTQPPKPGPEWPLLLHLADDADDGTRWTACGVEYMMARTHAPKSTVMRWLKTLRESGLIRVVSHSKSAGCGGGKGQRAVYEISIPAEVLRRPPAHLNQVSPTVGPDSLKRSHKKRTDSGANEVPWPVRPDYPDEMDVLSNEVPPAVRPPTTGTSSDGAPLEGADLRSDQDRGENEERKKHTAPQREARRAPAA